MKKVLAVLILALVASPLAGLRTVPTAQAADSFSFDMGNLISDAGFNARDEMSAAQIHAFLEAKNSVLTKVPASDLGPGHNNRSAAQIIYDASRQVRTDFGSSAGFGPSNPMQVRINPQVLVVTLQKEQGLVTAAYQPGSTSTNNALRVAMGYACPDGAPCDSDYYGFTNQVMNAAAQLFLDQYRAIELDCVGVVSCRRIGQTYTIGNTQGAPYYAPASYQVTIRSGATSALYRYTPWVYNGNRNFAYFMTEWFAPNYQPPLVKAANDPTVYIVEGGVRYPIESIDVFETMKFSWDTITTMTPQQQAMPVGGVLRRLVLAYGAVFRIENGTKRRFSSARVFNTFGYSWNDISDIGPLAVAIPEGMPMYELVKASGSDPVYIVAGNKRYVFPSIDMFKIWGMNWAEMGTAPAFAFATVAQTKNVTRIAKGTGDTVYLIDQGRRLAIESLDAFQHWKFSWGDQMSLPDRFINERPAGPMLTRLVKGSSSTVYYVENGTRRPIASAAAFSARGFSWGSVAQVSDALLATLPVGSTIK